MSAKFHPSPSQATAPASVSCGINLHVPVIGIDLGASYTKVSWRQKPIKHCVCNEPTYMLFLDGSTTVPSLLIETGDIKRPWLFGAQAAAVKPGPHMRVHLNWKSGLFLPLSDPKHGEAFSLAKRFFSWLRQTLEDTEVSIEESRVRITVPAFDNYTAFGSQLAECLRASGWASPEIVVITEPRSNMIGLFAKGVNRATWDRSGTKVHLNYNAMYGTYGPFLLTRTQHSSWGTHSKYLKCMILDIGAFTTDAAFVTINTDAADVGNSDGLEYVHQVSYKHGIIDQLDEPLITELFSRHYLNRSDFSFQRVEEMKRDLYSGKTFPITTRLDLGDAADKAIVSKHIDNFRRQCWDAVAQQVRKHEPEWAVLTGGGSQIPILANAMKKTLGDNYVRPAKYDHIGRKSNAKAPWRDWGATGEPLARVATALGAGSIVSDAADFAPPPVLRSDPVPAAAKRQSQPIYTSCTCGGLNPDCARCNGSGTLRV